MYAVTHRYYPPPEINRVSKRIGVIFALTIFTILFKEVIQQSSAKLKFYLTDMSFQYSSFQNSTMRSNFQIFSKSFSCTTYSEQKSYVYK